MLDPTGKWRDDLNMASLQSLITNIVRSLFPEKGKKPKMTNPNDFMIKWGDGIEKDKPVPKKQSTDEMKQVVLGIASAVGTKHIKENGD
jgi:hypothetical protein